jgi:hypothetical protein
MLSSPGANTNAPAALSQESTVWDREAENENERIGHDLSNCATAVLLTPTASKKAALTHRVAHFVATGICASVGHAEPPARAHLDLIR